MTAPRCLVFLEGSPTIAAATYQVTTVDPPAFSCVPVPGGEERPSHHPMPRDWHYGFLLWKTVEDGPERGAGNSPSAVVCFGLAGTPERWKKRTCVKTGCTSTKGLLRDMRFTEAKKSRAGLELLDSPHRAGPTNDLFMRAIRRTGYAAAFFSRGFRSFSLFHLAAP